MIRPARLRRSRWPLVSALAAVILAASGLAGLATPAAAAGLPRWTGGVDLYRTGIFSTQQTWLWCTAADLQMSRNIVDHQADHSASAQGSYFDWMRAHNRYRIPVTDGVDMGGWTAGLQHFVDPRYRLVASRSFDAALRSAVTNLRRTNLPVAIAVMHGDHGWLITGFAATADPAVTATFRVTSVRVVGPLWGLQSRTYGYDMRPDTALTPAQLAGFFTPWRYASVHMAWEGTWASVQGIAAAPRSSGAGSPAGSPATPSSGAPSRAASTTPLAAASNGPATPAVLQPATVSSATPDPVPAATASSGAAANPAADVAVAAGVVLVLVVVGAGALARRRSLS